jgi:hypothetical protein
MRGIAALLVFFHHLFSPPLLFHHLSSGVMFSNLRNRRRGDSISGDIGFSFKRRLQDSRGKAIQNGG